MMFSIHIILILFIKGIIQKENDPFYFDKLQFLDKLVSPTLRLYALTFLRKFELKHVVGCLLFCIKNVRYLLENK